jgi:hypothetical protein
LAFSPQVSDNQIIDKSPHFMRADSGDIAEMILAPLRGSDRLLRLPTAYAVGCIVKPLRGYRIY